PKSPRAVRSVVLVAVPAGLKIQPDAVTNVPPAQAQVIGVWSPLFPVFALPPGVAYTLPAGFEYKLWVLYQPQGKPVSGAIQVHMHEPDKQSRLVQATRVQHPAFTIKERESKWLTVTQKIDRPSTLYSVTPLARFYCNVIKVSVKQPNGPETEIATINKHDPYWTQTIQLSSPLKLQAGATVISKYFYANDKYCRMNEGKEPEIVKSGQKITDEACELRLLLSD
ncbi:MAG TPA: hypothetical protein VK171_13045, partial [Fimbriimonas sp.]|nr:hypothetical protein [Fimbriimonas sp.]